MINYPQLKKFILILEKLTYFVDQKYYFFTDCAFGQGNEEIANVFLCKVSQKITVNVTKICDVLFQKGKGVDE